MTKPRFTRVFIFVDTDKHASPFDILTTIDLFPNAKILKYEKVTVEDAAQIVYDAIFPRGPKGARYTKLFINGRDFVTANAMLEKVQKCMVPPFEIAVIIDPRGAYTTASAAVAKTLQISVQEKLGSLKHRRIAVLAGTGAVGQTAARLFASEEADVIITSRFLEKASSLAAKISGELGDNRITGVQAKNPTMVGRAIENADIILAAGSAGTQLLPITVLKAFGKNCKILLDVNAIPPTGVEGLAPNADGKTIFPEVFGVGALTIGKLKNEVEIGLIKKATDAPRGVFDYRVAYELAKKIVLERQKR